MYTPRYKAKATARRLGLVLEGETPKRLCHEKRTRTNETSRRGLHKEQNYITGLAERRVVGIFLFPAFGAKKQVPLKYSHNPRAILTTIKGTCL